MNAEIPTVDPNTKERITATALELFANQGYHKTSINQIAKTVGVSKSLIYNYFESKDHLLAHIIDVFIEKSMDMVHKIGGILPGDIEHENPITSI